MTVAGGNTPDFPYSPDAEPHVEPHLEPQVEPDAVTDPVPRVHVHLPARIRARVPVHVPVPVRAQVPVLKARLKTGLSARLPRTRARSLPRLRAAYPDLAPDELAARLVSDAARNSAAVGAVAACCALAPIPAAAPLVTVCEPAASSALRTRLTAELHTVYGLLDPSPVNGGATGHLMQWASRDAAGPLSLAAVPALTLAAAKALPRNLRRRMPGVRTLFATTAVTAALRSGRETQRYGDALRRDLNADPTAWSRWPEDAH
jgi:hypothetical protein